MKHLSSSLRTKQPEETLKSAKSLAPKLGITRVTDTTYLDKIDIPVYASIRPEAQTLCVNAGKGRKPIEAEVGAYMEAIEFAYAEYGRSKINTFHSTVAEVSNQFADPLAFLDFAPLYGVEIDANDRIPVANVKELLSGKDYILPAELIFLPYRDVEKTIFSTSSNGLSSGNSILEASIHGLAELIERDISSYQYFHDQSEYVELNNLPQDILELTKKIEKAGLQLSLRYSPNKYNFPHFTAYVIEPDDNAAIAICRGIGLHPVKSIAAIRAITEAAQSRLTHIHGGRDDIINRANFFAQKGKSVEEQANKIMRTQIMNRERSCQYQSINCYEGQISNLEDCWQLMLQKLQEQDLNQIFFVQFTEEENPLKVIKMIVPGLEFCSHECARMGRRLKAYVESLA